MLHKLKNQRGETLVEVMASIVIAALSAALLFGCVMASIQISRAARRADEAYYKALTAAETQTEDADCPKKSGTVKIVGSSETEWEILLYGGGGMYAYARSEGADP